MSTTLVWFRRDLRLDDNPALAAAAAHGPVAPLFVWAPDEEEPWAPGSASRWWLHQSLAALSADLAQAGARLRLSRGASVEALLAECRRTGARRVVWNRLPEPHLRGRDEAMARALASAGIEAAAFDACTLWRPGSIRNGSGNGFQVFTPFWRAGAAMPVEAPGPRPARLQGVECDGEGLPLAELGLLPAVDWASGLHAAWAPGEAGALDALQAFAAGPMERYATDRDLPALPGVSRLAPHLHFGEVSPRRVWHDLCAGPPQGAPAEPFLRQLAWREFAHDLLAHHPETDAEPLRPEFARFPWRSDPEALRRWQRGQTGYPIVDAGMRELWATGWMHNRVRMIAASFLVKDLLIPWQEGARWFWETLVDADLANNTMGWQWVAGCGADAAPYFRVFNPSLQGARFDTTGAYVRRWVPELAGLADRWLHAPWEAPADALRAAGVELGSSTPRPMVDHAQARQASLAAYKAIAAGR
jgi:deoxyribodipyrimidine photo-lyase